MPRFKYLDVSKNENSILTYESALSLHTLVAYNVTTTAPNRHPARQLLCDCTQMNEYFRLLHNGWSTRNSVWIEYACKGIRVSRLYLSLKGD